MKKYIQDCHFTANLTVENSTSILILECGWKFWRDVKVRMVMTIAYEFSTQISEHGTLVVPKL